MTEVLIRRLGAVAQIEYPSLPGLTVTLHLGPGARALSDADILDRYQRRIAQLAELMIAAPQVDWDDVQTRWRPRSRALRCSVDAGAEPGSALVSIDELDLTLDELGAILADHGAHVCLLFLED